MPAFSGKMRKINGEGTACATVEVMPSSEFRVECVLTSRIQVQDFEGEMYPEKEIEVACMSGATYARHVLPLSNSRIVVRTAQGTIAPLDIEGFAIATVLAIGRALGREESIPAKTFQGAFGAWEVCENY